MNKYQLSYTLTFIEEKNRIYNWLNGEYVEFEDLEHPFFKIVKNKLQNFEKFSYQNSYDDFEWLLQKKFIVKEQKEIYQLIKENVVENNSNKYLQLILLPVQMACNFACVYCYEDKNQTSRMKNKQLNILYNFVKKQENLENLQIEWFGGEPMLNLKFILDFSKKIQKFSKIKNINYQGSMTTNAYYLCKDNFLKLYNVGIRSFQITLDGTEETHNKLRPLSNGNPTFKTIINNLIDISNLKNLHFNITIRINFNHNSDIDNFIEYVKKINFSFDKRFSFIFRPIKTNWNNKDNNVYCKSQPSYLQKQHMQKAIENNLLSGDYMLYQDIGSCSCYASKENSLVIYPDMSIRKCTVALDDEVNIVGYINDNSELIKNKNWNLWLLNTNSIHNKQECKQCAFNPQCLSSSCPLKFIKNFEISCPTYVYSLEDISNEIINFLEVKN